jgi:5-methylcytosine-specific restriction enzyme subunit McrC
MIRLPGVPLPDVRMLRHLAAQFAEVTILRAAQPRPQWTPTRLNARYHTALRLAQLVLDATSITGAQGVTLSTGFLLDMPRVFEDFLTAALRSSIEIRYGGAVVGQFPDHLDHGRSVAMVPDILWRLHATVSAVVDAKYKAHTPSADVYQMLAYCTAYGLRSGHLVYVSGDHPPGVHRIRNTDVEIVRHGLDLGQQPKALLADIDRIADRIVDVSPPPRDTVMP